MKNQRYTNAKHIEVTFPYAREAGEPVRVGSICGVAVNKTENGARGTIWLDGSYDLQVTGAVASEGLPVYITAAGALNVTATGNYRFGTSLSTKAGATIGAVEVAPIGYTDQTAVGA
jgi:predicted RecA/RadA family phage recombinase